MTAPFTTATKEEMFSPFVPWSADECIRAFESQSKKLHQGIAWSNSTVALGLRSLAVENRVGSRCTGKERDTESGLDNFGARYNSSALGRFMTPDWAAKPTTVPYASFGDPQTLNLYAYVENSPINQADADGHAPWGYDTSWGPCGNSDFCQQNGKEAWKEASDDNARGWSPQGCSTKGYICAGPQKKTHHHKHPKPKPKGLPKSGDASIYSDWFEGKTTANGETFHQSGNTAALLPKSRWHAVKLGTKVKLTHDDKSVVVEINDRGAGDRDPNSTRTLDLSRTAASTLSGQEINDDDDAKQVGLIHLDNIEVVPADTPVGPPAPQQPQ